MFRRIRFACRSIRHSLGLYSIVVFSLAVGIGANAGLFGVVNALFLTSLPVPGTDRLVIVQAVDGAGEEMDVRYSDYLRLKKVPLLQELAACSETPTLSVRVKNGNIPIDVNGEFVSRDYFGLLGLRAGRGRLLSQAPGDAAEAVLSARFWRRFVESGGGIGTPLTLNNNVQVTAIGVLPPEFTGDSPERATDIWIPIDLQPRLMSQNWLQATWISWVRLIGRVRPGVSFQQLEAALNRAYLEDETRPRFAIAGTQQHLRVQEGKAGFGHVRGRLAKPLWAAMSVLVIVLFAACINIANLLLMHGVARRSDAATRISLGANGRNLVADFAMEQLLVIAAAGILAVGVGIGVQRTLTAMLADLPDPIVLGATWDPRVTLFLVVACLATTTLCSFGPILQMLHMDVNGALRMHSGSLGRVPTRRIWQRGLVSAQIMCSLAVVLGTLVLLRSLQRLYRPETTVSRDNIVVASLPFDLAKAGLHIQRRGLLADDLTRIPGVLSVSFATFGPLGGGSQMTLVAAPALAFGAHQAQSSVNYISPNYFRTYGIPLLGGREFDGHDTLVSRRVVILNEAAARFLGPAGALGKTLTLGPTYDPTKGVEVVGIVKDVRTGDLRAPPRPTIFIPLAQRKIPAFSVALRAKPGKADIAAQVRAAFLHADPDVQLDRVSTYSRMVHDALGQENILVSVCGGFAVLLTLLVALGVYGSVSYIVIQRTPEIGLRMSFGATRNSVVMLVSKEVFLLLGIGILATIPVLWAGGRILQAIVAGTGRPDALSIAIAVAVTASAVGIATYVPARRAAAVDPARALRC